MKGVLKSKNFGEFKTNIKSFAKTRVGVTVCSWIVGFSLVLFIGLPLAHINKTYQLGVMVGITCILAICSLITVFARYVDSESFPVSAYFQIGIIYFLTLASIGLLAVDLSFTIEDRYLLDIEQLEHTQTFITIMWNIIYWGSLLFGSVLNQFFTRYWQSGHFKVWDRVKQTIKGLVIRIIAGGIALVAMFFLVFVVLKVRDVSGIKAVALILTNVINMLQLVVLLAYGLFNLPIFLWKYADKKQTLYQELERAETVRQEYRAAVADFYMIVSQCRNMITNHRTGANTAYMDILDSELPKKDLDGTVISHSSNFTLDLLPGQDVTEDYIANVRYQFRVQYFLYKRKKSRWMTLYDQIDSLIQKPVNYDKEYLTKDLEDPEKLPILDEMALKPKPNNPKDITTFRIFSMISLVFCLFVLITEGTVIYDPHYTLMYIIVEDHPLWKYRNWSFSVIFLASIVFVCFFTIFNSKFSDFLQLVPRHTDCLQLSSVVSMCCKIITVSCFNYMTILGEVTPGMEDFQYATCYTDFYSSMIKVPFLGSNFNTIMPGFILIFGLVFAVFSIFKLKSKTLTAIKNFTKKNIVEDGADVKSDPKAAPGGKVAAKGEPAVANAEEQNIVQRILKGERAILLEIEHKRKKEERMKLLRFNNVSAVDALQAQKQSDIELASQSSKTNNPSSMQPNPPKGPKTLDQIMAEAKQKKQLETPLLHDGHYGQSKPAISGAKRMQFGIFKKAQVVDSDQDEDEMRQDNNQQSNLEKHVSTKPSQLKKAATKKASDSSISEEKVGANKKQMDVDSEEEIIKGKKIKPKPKPAKGKKKKSIFDDDYTSSEDEKIIDQKHGKSGNKGLKFNKEGYIYKKKQKTVFTRWDKRYLVLENEKLKFYEDNSKKTLKKEFDLANITTICFHYDEKAPNASKKIREKEKDESRFDIYIKAKPVSRRYLLKTDEMNIWEAEDWVNTLKEAVNHYSNL